MDSEFEELEIKTEIEIQGRKPPDVSMPIITLSDRNPPPHSYLNESRNTNELIDASKYIMIKLEGL